MLIVQAQQVSPILLWPQVCCREKAWCRLRDLGDVALHVLSRNSSSVRECQSQGFQENGWKPCQKRKRKAEKTHQIWGSQSRSIWAVRTSPKCSLRSTQGTGLADSSYRISWFHQVKLSWKCTKLQTKLRKSKKNIRLTLDALYRSSFFTLFTFGPFFIWTSSTVPFLPRLVRGGRIVVTGRIWRRLVPRGLSLGPATSNRFGFRFDWAFQPYLSSNKFNIVQKKSSVVFFWKTRSSNHHGHLGVTIDARDLLHPPGTVRAGHDVTKGAGGGGGRLTGWGLQAALHGAGYCPAKKCDDFIELNSVFVFLCQYVIRMSLYHAVWFIMMYHGVSWCISNLKDSKSMNGMDGKKLLKCSAFC